MAVEFPPNKRRATQEIRLLSPLLTEVYLKFNLEPPRIPERPTERYPIIVVFGPPGGGKTKAAERLAGHFAVQVLYERIEENEFVSSSYSRRNPEVAIKSQIKFLLLKFQDYIWALELSQNAPVIIEPSKKMDTFYALTFRELGKINEEQYRRYLRISEAMDSFIFPGDLAISVIPDRAIYDKRIEERGRDYEQAGFTEEFRRRIIELCLEEESEWRSQERCLSIGHLDYVHGGVDPALLVREFGLKATEIWGQGVTLGTDGARVLCPEGWDKFRISDMRPDDCRFRKRY